MSSEILHSSQILCSICNERSKKEQKGGKKVEKGEDHKNLRQQTLPRPYMVYYRLNIKLGLTQAKMSISDQRTFLNTKYINVRNLFKRSTIISYLFTYYGTAIRM